MVGCIPEVIPLLLTPILTYMHVKCQMTYMSYLSYMKYMVTTLDTCGNKITSWGGICTPYNTCIILGIHFIITKEHGPFLLCQIKSNHDKSKSQLWCILFVQIWWWNYYFTFFTLNYIKQSRCAAQNLVLINSSSVHFRLLILTNQLMHWLHLF